MSALPYLADGWHEQNPNNAECDQCHSTNLRFFWQHGEPKAVECLKRGWSEHNPK